MKTIYIITAGALPCAVLLTGLGAHVTIPPVAFFAGPPRPALLPPLAISLQYLNN